MDNTNIQTRPFHIYDVFTDTPFTGNPLAIVENADGLTTAQMQTIAWQFNLSETIFVQTPDDPAHAAKVRIFFPTAEIPFAGHPTIGCALHLAHGDEITLTLEEQAGLVPVTFDRSGGKTWAEFTAPKRALRRPRVPTLPQIANALGLTQGDIGPHNPGIYEGGPAFLYVPVRNLANLAHAWPMEPAWSAMMAACNDGGPVIDSAYLYTPGDQSDYQARMFAPRGGIPEDPATGSATALLAGQLLKNGVLRDGQTMLTLRQGVEMGRPSDLRLAVDVVDGMIKSTRVAGQAVHMATGQIRLP